MKKEWIIYSLLNDLGEPFYIGKTTNLEQRLSQHQYGGGVTGKPLGFRPSHIVLERGYGNWRPVEARWIKLYLERGFKLENIYWGQGASMMPERTRQKLKEIVTGRPCTWGDKISAAQKGQKRNWSKAGYREVQKTQFKQGRAWKDSLSPEAQESIREKAKEKWKDPELRERMSVGLKRGRDPDVHARAAKTLSKTWSADPRRFEKARIGGLALVKKHPHQMRDNVKKFWKELRKDSERYNQYISSRTKAIKKGKADKATLPLFPEN